MIGMIGSHAMKRAAQRNISPGAMDFVLRHGIEIYRSGALFIFLRNKDIPDSLTRERNIDKLIGTTILISTDEECIITAYKNRRALKDIKRKDKKYLPKAA